MKTNLIRIICLILSVAMLTALAGCGKGTQKEETSGSYTEAAQIPSTNTTPEATENAIDTSDSSTEAYRQYLLKVAEENSPNGEEKSEYTPELTFGFFYLNDDDIPEVWYTDTVGAHGASYVILAYRDGKVVKVLENGMNILKYSERKSAFCIIDSVGPAYGGGSYYIMTNDGCDVMEEYTYERDFSAESSLLWKQNGMEEAITDTELENRIKDIQDKYESIYGTMKDVSNDESFVLNEENILKHCK